MAKYLYMALFLLLLGEESLYAGNESRKPTQDLWAVIRQESAFNPKLVYHPAVRRQIHWFSQQQPYITELTRNARPYIYYVLQQTQSRKMPPEIALLPMIESNYDPFAYSRVGTTGLWQLMPGTASGLGLHINWWYDGRRDIIASTDAALNYLKSLHNSLHDWLLAIAAYNAGEGTVRSAIRYNQQHHRPTDFWSLPLPTETREYVPKLLALAYVLQHHERYGLRLEPVAHKPFFTSVRIKKPLNFAQLANVVDTSVKNVRQLNPGFRRWETEPNRTYYLLIPIEKAAFVQQNLIALGKRTPAHSQWVYHRVNTGDSLKSLALRYNTSVESIRQKNALKSDLIHIGEKLLIAEANAGPRVKVDKRISEDGIPGPKHVSHIVKPHDTIRKIAKRYRVTAQQIYYWNGFDDHTSLKPDQQLTIWTTHITQS